MPWYYHDKETNTWAQSATYKNNARWFAEGIPTHLIEAELERKSTSYPYTGHSYTPPVPPKPWEGVDKSKWPNTFAWLVMFYYQPSYNMDTRYKS